MSDAQKLTWDADELQKVMAAHHVAFDEQHKILMARLDKPLPDWKSLPSRPLIWEPSAAAKEADARLKVLLEYIRNLPPRDSIAD
jgi:hypothetical protein